MFEGIAGGIGGAMLEYAAQKKWGWRKIFVYPLFTFTMLGFLAVHLFFPTTHGILMDFLISFLFGIFSSLSMLVCYYFKLKEKK